jgi:2-polyprenyl-3-methyl-5-hydroxy-6-metoxy-1,4-benzoquinol methylase
MAAQGNTAQALEGIVQSFRIGETEENKAIFVDIIKGLRFSKNDGELRVLLRRGLTECWSRPLELAGAAADLAKLDFPLGACVERCSQAWPQLLSAADLFRPTDVAALAADQLLHALLISTQNIDIALEKFLTNARFALLNIAKNGAARFEDVEGLTFFAALARQCFINEYVFHHTDEEIGNAIKLRDWLITALQNQTSLPDICVLAVAAYFPLSSLPFAAFLLDRHWPDCVTAVLTQQLREPAEESNLRADIPQLTTIENNISRLVRDQYEENPYPRWVRTAAAAEPTDIANYLRRQFPLSQFEPAGDTGQTKILIAGCGTGQHGVEVAQRIHGDVLAIDLSLGSLAYALRKTREMGLSEVSYVQADILELASLGLSFDVIECAGVLHHMSDPFAGWRALLSVLRPGGCMMVGIYSKTARRNVAKAQQYFKGMGFGPAASDIRRCRRDYFRLERGDKFGIATSADFFCISSCRDLLFPACERQIELGGVQNFLQHNDLLFLGFEADARVLHAYTQRFPKDPAAIDLNNWQVFEQDNPDIFSGMYNFWIQKAR